MQRLRTYTALLSAAIFSATFTARAEQPRTALVVGNSSYASAPLANPVNDAADVAKSLGGAGFAVNLVLNADKAKMLAAIKQFGATLAEHKGGVGFFYYAGHGVQIAGENYLVPVDANLGSERAFKASTVAASGLTDAMAAAKDTLNILVLDACRNNPLDASRYRGLSRIDTSDRLFVSFSTKPGAVALDGDGRNSPYAKHLALAIGTPRLDLERAFKQTLKGVYQETHGEQTPWISSSYFGEFVFKPANGDASSYGGPQAQDKTLANLGGVYRADGVNPNGSRYIGITAVTGSGSQTQFKWWIGKDIFKGTGEFAGKMIVVNWGQSQPVIYTMGKHGFLDGEWADGKATERLELFAAPSSATATLKEGRYAVTGRNPAGNSYRGTVSIARQASGGYSFDWKVGSSAYHGNGKLEDGIVTVDWGSNTPVVYALVGDGELRGLWSGGAGEETASLEE
jgi:Caspase domain